MRQEIIPVNIATMNALKKLRATLQRAQLSEAEIGFFEAVVRHPGKTVFELGRRAGFQKDKAYALFESLFEKGLVEISKIGRKRTVVARPLSIFSEKLMSSSRKLWHVAQSLKELNSALPFLKENAGTSRVESFEVSEFPEHWMDIAYSDFENAYGYGNFDMITNAVGADCDRQFITKRVKRGARAQVALLPGAYNEEMQRNDGNELRETRTLHVPQLGNMLATIFPEIHTVSLWHRRTGGAIAGILIQNALLTEMHAQLFRYFHSISSAIPKK